MSVCLPFAQDMRKSMGGTPPIEEVSKPKKIKEQRTIVFQPCSPGQVCSMPYLCIETLS